MFKELRLRFGYLETVAFLRSEKRDDYLHFNHVHLQTAALTAQFLFALL